MKGKKNEILTKPECRHISRSNVSFFFAHRNFLKHLPIYIAHIAQTAKATHAIVVALALSNRAIFTNT